ncbi:thiolase family protein [Mycolicibacterium fortuitum]|uniref:Thiolase family protein n=2 Tax=Mycolicibacterium fortuitum TaxID=1766 RepID=A0AAE4VA25_MYCFO|nr:thiolase family protein [Mycolicibacterium fortuitum]MCV7143798.1 thiolase family protein [Mycolicibacterium fortuitum]MDV7190993.1 thiolase family protein [Mycolicibacterium fortuitum]MDV7204199.1 thiolase family protein [Mycolicibacterium fortuitum]MDV7229093.1 thiolase family protein [Mycolicibacterium fortuitum]MDV7259499.1 thiolase family protein [Mycolicibacterium fortuitum]
MAARRGLQGDAAIVGYVELPPERLSKASPAPFTLEQWALLASSALEDAGLSAEQVDGIVTSHLGESEIFVPSTVAEYLGVRANFAELLDLGGASAAGMVWRAAAAIELGLCDVVLCALPARYITPSSELKPKTLTDAVFFGSSSNQFGSPQAEFDIPYGNLGQNGPYGQVAQRYAYEYGYDERAMAKIVVDQRVNANHTDGAIWKDTPLTIEDVLASPVIADPLHMLEIVMPCVGGAAVVVASAEVAARARNRPVWIKGFGEHVPYKTPTYAENLLDTPIRKAADTAFGMTDLTRDQMDMVSIYDCYTITVLLSLEDAGFCEKGKGMSFVSDHDLTFRGDFPLNTAGGQLGFGQAGLAGGMHHVCDTTRQLMGRAGAAQIADCNRAFVSGNGGILSEQTTLILEGD